LHHACCICISDNESSVPLWEAIKGGHASAAQFLWENNATLNSEEDGKLLQSTIQKGDTEVFLHLLKYGAKISSLEPEDMTSLQAAISTHFQIISSDSTIKLIQEGLLQTQSGKPSPTFNKQCCRGDKYEVKLSASAVTSSKQRSGAIDSKSTGIKKLSGRVTKSSKNFELSLFKVVSESFQPTCNELNNLSHISYPHRVRIFRGPPHTNKGGEMGGKLIRLPRTFEELMRIAGSIHLLHNPLPLACVCWRSISFSFAGTGEKLNMKPEEVLSADGAGIDDLLVIRDNELLYFC
jgi:hypothetical protein